MEKRKSVACFAGLGCVFYKWFLTTRAYAWVQPIDPSFSWAPLGRVETLVLESATVELVFLRRVINYDFDVWKPWPNTYPDIEVCVLVA